MGMEQQAAIVTAHHLKAQANEARGAIAELVRNPIPASNGVNTEQSAGDLAVCGAGKPSVESAQGEDETIAPRG